MLAQCWHGVGTVSARHGCLVGARTCGVPSMSAAKATRYVAKALQSANPVWKMCPLLLSRLDSHSGAGARSAQAKCALAGGARSALLELWLATWRPLATTGDRGCQC